MLGKTARTDYLSMALEPSLLSARSCQRSHIPLIVETCGKNVTGNGVHFVPTANLRPATLYAFLSTPFFAQAELADRIGPNVGDIVGFAWAPL